MKRLAPVALLLLLSVHAPLRGQESEAQRRQSEAQKVAESTGITEHGPGIFWGWLNFLLLAGGLAYLIRKNAGPYFAQRSLEIRKGIVEADAVRAESEAKVAEVDRRLAHLDAEVEALRRGAQEEAAAEAERVRKEAAAEMAKVQSQMMEEIAAAGKSATLELRRYSAELAVSVAERKIAARMSPETQDRLVQIFVATMAQADGAGRN